VPLGKPELQCFKVNILRDLRAYRQRLKSRKTIKRSGKTAMAPVYVLKLRLLIATHRRFPLTPLVYRLLFVHGLILMLGGAYTYARVPLGFWLQDALDLSRNHYDRLGHLAQGFIPAMLAREILVRATPLRPGGWLFFLVTCVVLAISASYEFIEWGAALAMGADADAFLATQGDVWDTQWDMFLALLGALAAQSLLSRLHNRQLARLPGARPRRV
jgi:putative membrane protein